MSDASAAAPPPAERTGWAVLAKGRPLEPHTFTLPPLRDNEVDIRVTVRRLCETGAACTRCKRSAD